jgi:iron complex outermembrane recepter protein
MFGEAPPINVFNPVYGNVPRLTFGPGEGFPFFFDNEWYGIYVQDQIAPFNRLHLLVGARYDSTTATRFGQELKDDQFSPRFGLVYQFFPWLSVYSHYVEALGLPNAGLSREEELFEPERSQQYEVGFKTEFLQRRLSATVALFDLTKQNILTPDPVNPAFSLAIGKARSRGIELDVSGHVTDRLSLIGSYAAAMDTEILRDTRDNEGNRLPNAPGHSGSLWAEYQATPQFNVGAGVFAVGRREIDQAKYRSGARRRGVLSMRSMPACCWESSGRRSVCWG